MGYRKEIQIWDCPFCGKNTIQILYFPSSARPYKTTWSGSKPGWKISKEQALIQSRCSNCGKTIEEVERKLTK